MLKGRPCPCIPSRRGGEPSVTTHSNGRAAVTTTKLRKQEEEKKHIRQRGKARGTQRTKDGKNAKNHDKIIGEMGLVWLLYRVNDQQLRKETARRGDWGGEGGEGKKKLEGAWGARGKKSRTSFQEVEGIRDWASTARIQGG